ncbi:hypothetical protein CRG98_018888 [Punica granatum]|uniref:Uncharacterized protein n=1 Tax=Punica granatum TaxID=22663 RepID=A0A2I0JWN1_PUNGR|nr:hypothetical protein CRG98_018888 [Punica granatum]
MAEGDQVDISEEVNPPVLTLSQPPPKHAPPPTTLAGVLPAYSAALPTHLSPPASSGAPLPLASLTSAATDDQARIAALEGTDIPTWEDLTDQYRYCAETPPTLLELSTKEMARGQRFEEYATKWRAQAAKHIPPISEAGKKLDLGIKLGRMEGPTVKEEKPTKRTSTTPASSGGRRGKEVSVNAVNPAHPTSQQYSINYTPLPLAVPTYTPPTPHYRPQQPSPVVHHYAPTPPQASQYRPASSGISQSAQQAPPPQGQPGSAAQSHTRRQYPVVPTRISSRRGTRARCLCNTAWECLPSRGRATDTREKESPLTVYDHWFRNSQLVLKPELPQLAHNSWSLSSFRPWETEVRFGAETPQLSRPLAHGSNSWIPSPRGSACASPSSGLIQQWRPIQQRRPSPSASDPSTSVQPSPASPAQ